MGVNIRTTVKKGRSAGSASSARDGGPLSAARLERPVVNCLSCGKIFDCRAVTNDTIQFLGGWVSGGARAWWRRWWVGGVVFLLHAGRARA